MFRLNLSPTPPDHARKRTASASNRPALDYWSDLRDGAPLNSQPYTTKKQSDI